MMVGVTKWPYDQASIDRRQGDCDYYGEDSANCHNEAWFIREMSHQFKDKFDLTSNEEFHLRLHGFLVSVSAGDQRPYPAGTLEGRDRQTMAGFNSQQ